MKPSSPGFVKAPIGLDYSPKEFQQRRGKSQWSNSYDDNGDYAPRQVALDQNNCLWSTASLKAEAECPTETRH